MRDTGARRLFNEARDDVERHRTDGHKVVLLTGGLMEMVRPLGDLLGVDEVMASPGQGGRGTIHGGIGVWTSEWNRKSGGRKDLG